MSGGAATRTAPHPGQTTPHQGRVLHADESGRVIDCARCGHAHLDPKPSADELARFYAGAFFEDENPDYLAKTERELDYWNDVVFASKERILRRRLGGAGRILDIGCCGGFLLRHFRSRGWEVLGVEPSASAADWATKRYGIPVVRRLFEDVPPGELGGFDAVHLAFVLEHVRDAKAVLRLARGVLRPGGVICVEVPNDFNALQRAVRDGRPDSTPWWVCRPDHVNYFDFDSLTRLLERNGFRCFRRQATFPMELFLLMGHDYLGNDPLGRACHQRRMQLERSLLAGGIEDPLSFLYDAWARRGLGREAIVYATRDDTAASHHGSRDGTAEDAAASSCDATATLTSTPGRVSGEAPQLPLNTTREGRPGDANEPRARSVTRVPHLVVDGLYGIRSHGDDAMLLALQRGLQQRLPGTRITVLSRHPDDLHADYGVRAQSNLDHPPGVERGPWFYGFNPGQPREHLDRLRDTLADADLLLIGGGNLLLDVTHDWLRGPIAWHAWISELARIHRVPYMLWANSIGPFATDWGRLRSEHVIRGAATVTVRDETSRRIALNARDDGGAVELAPDPALLLEPDVGAAAAILDRESPGWRDRGPLLALSVRDLSWSGRTDAADAVAALARVADQALQRLGGHVVFVPQCAYEHGAVEEDDRHVARQVRERMHRAGEATVLAADRAPAPAIQGLYRHAALALVTRLHGAVFAATCRTPFLALDYLPKVAGFLRHLDLSECALELEALHDPQALADRLASILADRDGWVGRIDRGVSAAAARATRHLDVAARLLERSWRERGRQARSGIRPAGAPS